MTGNTAPVFAAAKHHNVKIVTADELVLGINPHLQQKLEHVLEDHSVNYLTLCLDAFADPTNALFDKTTTFPCKRGWL